MAEADWLAPFPTRLRDPLRRAAAGLPANVTLMHILRECAEPDEAEAALGAAIGRLNAEGRGEPAARLAAVLELLRRNPQAHGVVHSVLAGLDHGSEPADAVRYWTAAFDAAAQGHPEGSVALYALGNPDLLAAATAEIVAKLGDWGRLTPAAECLDIGCGIGRLEAALAPRIRRIVGIDISSAMVEAARRRSAGLRNVEIRQASGRDLMGFADASFDLVLAVDSFPYMMQAGGDLPDRMISESARVLRPAGRLVIFNYSYRGDLAIDRADLRRAAARSELAILRDGGSEFSLWDGVAFDLVKPGPAQGSM